MTPAFFLMSAGLLLAPGPTNTLLALGGALSGPRRAWRLTLAALAGYLIAIHVLAYVAGPFVRDGSVVQLGLKLVLALYLLWLATTLWRAELLASQQAVTPQRVLLVTLLNPKALIFAFVILPPLAGQWSDAAPQLAALSAMIMMASACWTALGAALASGRVMGRDVHWLPRAGSLVLALFAVLMIASVMR